VGEVKIALCSRAILHLSHRERKAAVLRFNQHGTG